MKKRSRLTRRQDFQRLLGGRQRLQAGPGMVVMAAAREQGATRIGITVSRQLKQAVERNRARRRLREVARRTLLAPDSALVAADAGFDLVLIARPAALTMAYEDLEQEARTLLRRLEAHR